MNRIRRSLSACLVTLLLSGFVTAAADVTVSVNISGDLDELAEILKILKEIGVGQVAEETKEEPVRVQMHSVTTAPSPVAVLPKTTIQPVVRRPLSLSSPSVQPAYPRPGEKVLVSARLVDSEGVVDTVAATFADASSFVFDLYDNGTHGDQAAGDGVWSFSLDVPTFLGSQASVIVITAYDRSGDEVTIKNAKGESVPLSARVSLTVAP